MSTSLVSLIEQFMDVVNEEDVTPLTMPKAFTYKSFSLMIDMKAALASDEKDFMLLVRVSKVERDVHSKRIPSFASVDGTVKQNCKRKES